MLLLGNWLHSRCSTTCEGCTGPSLLMHVMQLIIEMRLTRYATSFALNSLRSSLVIYLNTAPTSSMQPPSVASKNSSAFEHPDLELRLCLHRRLHIHRSSNQ